MWRQPFRFQEAVHPPDAEDTPVGTTARDLVRLRRRHNTKDGLTRVLGHARGQERCPVTSLLHIPLPLIHGAITASVKLQQLVCAANPHLT
jgi:hypothetical protein